MSFSPLIPEEVVERLKHEANCQKGNHDLPFRSMEEFAFGDGTPPYKKFQCVHCKKNVYKHGDRVISASEYNDKLQKFNDEWDK